MEHVISLPHSQVPATCPYPKPALSSPYPQIPIPEDAIQSLFRKLIITFSGFAETLMQRKNKLI